MINTTSPLLTDLYQLNMIQAYLDESETDTAVFEFFVRKLPPRRQFLVAAGLENVLAFLEALRFSPDEIDWLGSTGRFRRNLLDYLANFRFTGHVHAMREGSIFFADEPILRVTAPLPAAQLVETRVLNILHFQTLIASKAARMVLQAHGKLLVDFGLRRAHEAQAGLMAARASYIAGFDGTATLLAERQFGIPTFGTMAHSYIEAQDSEAEAFERFALSRPDNLTLLLDTYDTEAAAQKVVALAPRLKAQGIKISSVRLDSGDLIDLSVRVRRILDSGGLGEVTIFASGGLDEEYLAAIMAAHAPIDGFGIGTALTTSSDVPALDCAYKLEEYAGRPRRKRSAGKATWPGRKQVWRRYGADGCMMCDTLTIEGDAQLGEPLLFQVMAGGQRLAVPPALSAVRARVASELSRLPHPMRRLDDSAPYEVNISPALRRRTSETDAWLAAQAESRR